MTTRVALRNPLTQPTHHNVDHESAGYEAANGCTQIGLSTLCFQVRCLAKCGVRGTQG